MATQKPEYYFKGLENVRVYREEMMLQDRAFAARMNCLCFEPLIRTSIIGDAGSEALGLDMTIWLGPPDSGSWDILAAE